MKEGDGRILFLTQLEAPKGAEPTQKSNDAFGRHLLAIPQNSNTLCENIRLERGCKEEKEEKTRKSLPLDGGGEVGVPPPLTPPTRGGVQIGSLLWFRKPWLQILEAVASPV